VKDYRYFIEHRYPEKSLVKLIGDRYSLNSVQRTMLYRGISSDQNNETRQSRLIVREAVAGQVVHIDGYNVLIALACYLSGKTVFIGSDHLLRDAAATQGKRFADKITRRALSLQFSYLKSLNVKELLIYYDLPVPGSREVFEAAQHHLMHENIPGMAFLAASADEVLLQAPVGVLATSDSRVIDRTGLPVFDLPYHILQQFFRTNIIDLGNIPAQ
jgi:hypothetical protein